MHVLGLMHARVCHLELPSSLHEYVTEAGWETEGWVHREEGAKLRIKCGEPKFRFLLEASTLSDYCARIGGRGLRKWGWGRALPCRFFLKRVRFPRPQN